MTADISARILHCDSHCAVVNKIAGEATEAAGKGMIDLPRLIAAALSAPHIVPPAADALEIPAAAHRLDVPVSGCVVFARTQAALQFLNDVFRGAGAGSSNAPERRYWAVIEPPANEVSLKWLEHNSSESAELVHWIQFDPRKNKSFAFDEPGPGRKKAILRCRLIGRGDKYLFMETELVTGRHHQIRAQFERLGLHIKGDLKYGAKRSERDGGIRLHARSLSFPDPADGIGGNPDARRITVQADPPLRDNLWLAFEDSVRFKETEE